MRKKGRIETWEQLKKACRKLKNTEVLNCAILVGDTGFDIEGNQLFKRDDNYIFNPFLTAICNQLSGGKASYQNIFESIKMFDREVELKKIKEQNNGNKNKI